jgi:hypothetical protein
MLVTPFIFAGNALGVVADHGLSACGLKYHTK